MHDALPKIRVTDPHSRDSVPLSASPASNEPSPSPHDVSDEERCVTPVSVRSKSSGKTSPTKPQRVAATSAPSGASNASASNGQPTSEASGNNNNNGEVDRAPIDPLSQQIFKRTQTSQDVLQKLRPTADDASSTARPFAGDGSQGPKPVRDANRSDAVSLAPSKKKGVSFLSRIIGNKKKHEDDSFPDDAASDTRPEGMDAELFSQPIDSSIGYQPRHPQPPGYIKIRSKFKKEREFDRTFLAQQLRTNQPPAQDAERPPSSSGASVRNNTTAPPRTSNVNERPVWALEFSKDGKYLAAGGQDGVLRVWAVISNPDERTAHEISEAGTQKDGEALHVNAPVFQNKPYREYIGHESTILDLSWSKNNFLLSSSMDKTVRLWHISRSECLCTFKHADFVPSIQFHPKDDRFFLAGSLDSKLRLWSIPDKTVAFWNQLPEMITAVAFTPDGKTAIAGTLSGLCMFYDTEGLKYQTQIHVKSSRGKNAKGSKITGIQAMHVGAGATLGDIKLLISSNDSRIRLYSFRDKGLEIKFRGQENNYSQIRASFSDDATYVICGSEDRRAYIWSTGPGDGENRSQRPVEMFDAHNAITTCAILAPTKTRQLLSNSEDPVYDLCNPPPVTLVSRTESRSSKQASEAGSLQGTPMSVKKAEGTPAYMARSAHPDGQIIVTADYQGNIKVFRQDCAHSKRKNVPDNWDTSSVFSRRTAGSGVRRSNSTKTRASSKRRDSTATTATTGTDRILSWRQDISGSSSIKSGKAGKGDRSGSPSKFSMVSSAKSSKAQLPDMPPLPHRTRDSTPSINVSDSPPRPKTSGGALASQSQPQLPSSSDNPMWLHGDKSFAYYNKDAWRSQLEHSRLQPSPTLAKSVSYVSRLSSEESSVEGAGEGTECKKCGCRKFNTKDSGKTRISVCTNCGKAAP
ncbi:wd repeat domain-containing protein [Diplodia corticola]|uniref:Wd repeat domain-containing protein n=1 Tax=Diplodia corticola TaxID=236234 RepID=A0A1J9QLQ7_9PEZI|nr:wd repeat domain-containing protein [Diplodia corticola]OJD29392.1 wd repeat domain-containing protein [Diplodia corticola]